MKYNTSQPDCFYNRSLGYLIVCNLLVAICSAIIIELPLKKYKRTEEYYWSSSVGKQRHVRSAGNFNLKLEGMVDNIMGESGEGYYTTLKIGIPPQEVKVLIDTGSANFAIACEGTENVSSYFHRQNSSTYSDIGTLISVRYTEGSWSGKLGQDYVALTSAMSLKTKVNIACIMKSSKFYTPRTDWGGILGMAYRKLSRPDESVEPFWDSLLEAYPDLPNVFSIQLCGSSLVHSKTNALHKGSLILGGVLPKLYVGSIFYTPIYKEWYYEVIITNIDVSNTSLGLDCKEYNMDKTIVDSGTTSIRLPRKVFKAVKKQVINSVKQHDLYLMPGEKFFDGVDLVCYEDMVLAFEAFPIISFHLMQTNNTSFRMDLTPQHYLRAVTKHADVQEGKSCVKYGFLPSDAGTVLGAIFIEAFYTIFDRANKRVGFAQTSCELPSPTQKLIDVTIHGPFNYAHNFYDCAFKKPTAEGDRFLKATIIFLAFSVVVFVPLCILVVCKVRKTMCPNRYRRHCDEPSNALPMSDSLSSDER